MKRFACTLAAATLLTASSAFAGTVLLNNGDKLTGQISKVTPDSVELVTAFAGKVTIQKSAVQTMWSDTSVVIVADNGAQRQAFVAPATEGKGWVETQVVAAAPQVAPLVMKPAAPPVKILDLEDQGLPIGPHWKNSLTLGLVNTTGNTESTTFSGEVAFNYKNTPLDLAFRFGGDYGTTEGQQNAERFYNDLILQRLLPEWNSDKWFLFAESHNLYDGLKGISLRSQNGIGLGYHVIKSEKTNLSLRAGPGFTYSRMFDESTHCDPTGLVGLHFGYVVNERTTFTQDVLYTNGLTDLNRFQVTSETALAIKLPELARGAGIKFLFRDDYDNTTQSPRKKNDTRFIIGATLDF